MKIKTVVAETEEEEIIIKCRRRTDTVMRLEKLIENATLNDDEMVLYGESTEHYVPKVSILFFEAFDNRVYAHTADKMLKTEYKLFELEKLLPYYFARVSKSVIVNLMLISSIRREIVGNGEIAFKTSDKKTYFSRSFYKSLKEKIQEIRF